MNAVFENSAYFGFFLTLLGYGLGLAVQKKTKLAVCNPLLISTVFIIAVLLAGRIRYQTFNQGAQYITYLLTPATVCLALPLYRQLRILKENLVPVLAGLTAGTVTCMALIGGMACLLHLERTMTLSLLPKSITTAIAIGVTVEIGGLSGITDAAVVITGILSTVVADLVFKVCRIKDPVAQGLALGASGHAIGTSKALGMGEVQGAMSSLAIVVTGIITVVLVPMVARFI